MDLEVKPISSKVQSGRPQAQARPSTQPNYLARRASGEWRRIRQGFTRQNVILFLRTMAWVAPLTLLIWVYAERAQDTKQSNLQMAIDVTSRDPKRTVTLVKPYPDKFIVCDLEGQSANLEHFMNRLSPTYPLIINIDTTTMQLGENSVSTKQKIMENPVVKADGITVDKCEPDVLTFDVDIKDERTATIAAPPGISAVKSVMFDPPTIRVSGPKGELDKNAVNGQLTVFADIADLPALASPGQHVVANVGLRQIDDLTYSKDKVNATLVITDPDVTGTLHNVPVLLTATREVLEGYTVTWEGFYSAGINIIGPPDKIAQLKDVNSCYLDLKITIDDVSDPRQMILTLRDLPPGVRLAPGQNLTESFTATHR
jgi:hypothetical protein